MVMPQFGNIPGLPTGLRPFAPPLTPQQLMQAGMDPRAYYGDQYAARAAAMAGEAPAETLRSTVATPMGPKAPQPGVGQQVKEGIKSAVGKGQEFLNTFMQGAATVASLSPEERKKTDEKKRAARLGRIGMAAGMISPVMEAIGEAQAGRPTGALGAIGGGAAGIGLGAAAARFIPGPVGKIAGAVLPAIGGLLGSPMGAQAAEAGKRKLTGEPTKGKEDELANQLAARGQILNQDLSALDRTYGVHLNYMRDLARDQANQDYLNFQRMVPELEKMKNNELIRQQSLNAHMAQQQAMLGTLATAGALAQGAQAETGANIRTALTSAPYAGSVLQAPQIRFG